MHRALIQQLDLAHIEDHSSGMVFWHPNGTKIYNIIQSYIREIHNKYGYLEIRTPIMLDKSLFELSGHIEKFSENMFFVKDEEKTFVLKPMSCPAHIEIYRNTIRSYKELPLRYYEFGMVHRNESSGSYHGLMRVKQFIQDDSHIFSTESQILNETKNYIDMVREIYSKFGFESFEVKLSTRPQNYMGEESLWDKAEESLAEACKKSNVKYEISPGNGAFYGPKLEMTLFDQHSRPWQCGTIQVDFQLPIRFGLSYVSETGSKTDRPVILHHAVLGSLERWIGIILENTCGNLPLWLAPLQTVVVQVSDKSSDYAHKVNNILLNASL